MASTGTRIFTGGMAILFLLTASAFTASVVYSMVTSKNASNQSQNSSQKLAGTKLKDFTPVKSIPKLKTIDRQVGTGKTAQAGDTVSVQYTGAVASTGVIFQSSLDSGQPATLALKTGPGGVIAGWAKGIPGMKAGGTRRLLIPANLAYGQSPPPGSGIAPGADLVFDVTLLAVLPAK